MTGNTDTTKSPIAKLGTVLGPLIFALLYTIPPFEELNAQDMVVFGVLLWMVIWWVTGAIPIYVTALLPLVLMPVFVGVDIKVLAGGYAHPIVFLLLGGSLFAIALERVNLNKKIALWLMDKLGYSQSRIIFSVCLVAWFFSMWMSNSATTMMMLPVAMTIIGYMVQGASFQPQFARCIILMLAYAATIGGMATLIGTPPNLVLASQAEILGGITIDFIQWMILATPLAFLAFLMMYFIMTKYVYKLETDIDKHLQQKLQHDYAKVGTLTAAQWRLMGIFGTVVFFWIFKKSELLWAVLPIVKNFNDTSIIMVGVFMLFLVKGDNNAPFINWYQDAHRLPLGVMLLIGGGIALAIVLRDTHLVAWVVSYMQAIGTIPLVILCIVIALFTTFLTEVNSNTATSIVLIPVFWGLAEKMAIDPMILGSVVALSASTAFMLPTATVPNAIVMQSEYLEVKHMMQSGILLNITIPVFLAIAVYYLLPLVF